MRANLRRLCRSVFCVNSVERLNNSSAAGRKDIAARCYTTAVAPVPGYNGKIPMLHDTLDEMMQEYAESAVELARDFGVLLDYSEQSIAGLEKILGQLSDEHRAFLSANPASASNETVDEQMIMMTKLWGGYLGEVVRRRWGGEWTMETYPGANFATLTLNVRGAKLFPSMKIYRRLTEGTGDDIAAFYAHVRQKLEASPN